MSGAVFRGMRPWALDAGIVECEGTALGVVDLHNEADVIEVVITTGGAVRLRFSHTTSGRAFAVVFTGVSRFEATGLDHHPDDAALFHDLSHVPVEGGSDCEITLAALRLELRAAGVEFAV
ncbi:hypothetical protein [Saccharothrix luteola]|uniref:hypothetical protein n=1 Tax=Saccharothrix luteola TaxID=2893018 RepID=UPI001E43062E|nr:hypothetical protein [Saccharothrix luteola]MCC8243417.1 hypothetical protein [Saccharothrix luteola]